MKPDGIEMRAAVRETATKIFRAWVFGLCQMTADDAELEGFKPLFNCCS